MPEKNTIPANDGSWFWLSYAHDGQFDCVVIIRAVDFLDACALVKMKGIAPGGVKDGFKVVGWPLDSRWVAARAGGLVEKRIGRRRAEKLLGGVEYAG